MTRDEIISMAVEAGGVDRPEPNSPGVAFLERFACLVASAQLRRCADLLDSTDLSAFKDEPRLQAWFGSMLHSYAEAMRSMGKTKVGENTAQEV